MKRQRRCGDCQLCCRLLPTKEIDKPHNTRCPHQCRTGCAIYARRPESCRLWNCRWLLGDDTGPRPDRAHLVVDMIPDYVTEVTPQGERHQEVIQIWIDPAWPNAHRAPAFRAWLERENMPALIRYGPTESVIVVPPGRMEDGQWHEKRLEQTRDTAHNLVDVLEKIGGRVVIELAP
jgi:hypothetical protein